MNKNKLWLGISVLSLCSMISSALAQDQMTALLLSSGHQSAGSARYQSLSGAMGAVGVDFSSLEQNPAGIALFRSGTKLSLSTRYTMSSGQAFWTGNDNYRTQNRHLYFDELSYMSNWHTSAIQNITFAFGYQSLGRFNREVDALASPWGGASVTDYIAARLNSENPLPTKATLTASNAFGSGYPWVGVLGAAGELVQSSLGLFYQSAFTGLNPNQGSLRTSEYGGADLYSLALGARLSSTVSLGFSLAYSNLNYGYRSSYTESYNADAYGLVLDNSLGMRGYGARFGVGVIVEPTGGLRLGLSVYTPTYYDIEMDFGASIVSYSPLLARTDRGLKFTTPQDAADAFTLRTPWRYVLSGSYVFGRKGLISVDYEYTNLGGARLGANAEGFEDEDFDDFNKAIKSDFDGRHTLRMGTEWNITPRLALRAGAKWQGKPSYTLALDSDVPTIEAMVEGTNLHYRMPGAQVGFSLGAGYRLSQKWTLDLGYIYNKQTDRLYAMPAIRDVATNTRIEPLKAIRDVQVAHSLVGTLSLRF